MTNPLTREELELAAKTARLDSDQYNARIFSREEMTDLWAHMIHVNVGEDVQGFVYEPWMEPLSKIYRQNYTFKDFVNGDSVVKDCEAAYKAGLAGDQNAVDRFVGGHELSVEEGLSYVYEGMVIKFSPLKCVQYIDLSFTVDARPQGGNMDETTPNEANNGKQSSSILNSSIKSTDPK